MKTCYLTKIMLITVLASAFLLVTTLYSGGSSNDSLYFMGYKLNEALYMMKYLPNFDAKQKMPYEQGAFYKYDFRNMRMFKIDKKEYLLNTEYGSPNGLWFLQFEKGRLVSALNTNDAVDLGSLLSFAWSPKSDKLAYIIGSIRDDYAATPSCPNGCPPPEAWIYDLNTREKKRLNLELKFYYISWPSFDSKIYLATSLINPQVYRYEPESKRLIKTAYRSIYFSPKGTYYFIPMMEEQRCRIYRREPHQELTALSLEIQGLAKKIHSSFDEYTWLSDDRSLLLPGGIRGEVQLIIFDLGKGKISKTKKGYFLGAAKNKNKALLMKGINQFEVIYPPSQ